MTLKFSQKRFHVEFKITQKEFPTTHSPFWSPSYPWRFLPTELHISQQRRRAVCRRQLRRAECSAAPRSAARRWPKRTWRSRDHGETSQKWRKKNWISGKLSKDMEKFMRVCQAWKISVSVATSCEAAERASLRISFEHIWNTYIPEVRPS